ncbi:hypothetical protein J4206_01215 [Candidatus Woesearchaeota archaeon]|nr:hypothetical protein [Candidatus Woesearchaeota archaeon]
MLFHKSRFSKRVRSGTINAVIWENTDTNEFGDQNHYNTISFERRYVKDDGNWDSTNCLRIQDLPKAAQVLKRVYENIALRG